MNRVILAFAVLFALAGAARADNPAARKACTDAMNADPTFAQAIVATANSELATKIHNYDITFSQLQEDAAARVAKNEQHVILAYAAMWIAAAVFLGFLWKRQRGLKEQIARLSADLDKALAEDKK